MTKRVSIINNMLDSNFLERILNTKISNEKLLQLNEKENREQVIDLTDLKDLKNKSEAEIYKALNSMVLNKQFFMFCGPILININPGPNDRENYLNLQNWLKENEHKKLEEKKPHLYTYIETVFEALVNERKDQVVNLLGQIGSGKTFNLVHILEYLCFFHAPDKKQIEFFDTIHKSIQLVHIMGSIFRNNNIESSSCGMQIRLGFDQNHKICNFELKANILDLTLPFSENGRSFSILHSIIASASSDLKHFLELPEREISLNFFKKFSQNFNKQTKDRFMLNDYEIWNRFHSLLNTFEFSKSEIIEILQLFSFILLCNEASIGKKRSKQGENYQINITAASKKLAKNFGMSEDEFIKFFGVHKDMEQTKNHLICLMKSTYNMIFEFIMDKVNSFLKNYFAPYLPKRPKKMHQFNDSFNVNAQKVNQKEENNNESTAIKYISFIDTPGEVSDQTLGGLLTNIANECQNLFAGGNFMSIIEKLQAEHIEIKYFQPIHSFNVVQAILSKEGILGYLSRKFTEKNFKSFNNKVKKRDFYLNCLKFVDEADDELTFDFKFSNKNVTFNYLSLYKEAKNCLVSSELIKLFSQSRNSVIKSQMSYISKQPKNIHGLAVKILFNLFENLKGSSPFVIYCLHSSKSLRTFFDKKQNNNNRISKEEIKLKGETWEIPKKESREILYHSIALPILYWDWYGFNEWIDVEMFVSEFADDFLKIQGHVNKVNKEKRIPTYGPTSKLNGSIVNIKEINPFEASEIMLKVFCKPKLYLLGSLHILFKKGTLNNIKELVKKVIQTQENCNKNMFGNNISMSKVPTGRRMSAKSTMMQNRTNINYNPSGRELNMTNKSMNKSINKSINKGKRDTTINIGTKLNTSNSKAKNVIGSKQSSKVTSPKRVKIANSQINSSVNRGNNRQDKNSSVNAIVNTEENYEMNMQEINEFSGGFSDYQNIQNMQNDTFYNNKIQKTTKNEETNQLEENENEKEGKYLCKRSMKAECHIEVIQKTFDADDNKANQEAKKDLGLNLDGDETNKKKTNFNNFNDNDAETDLLIGGKYSVFHIIDPQKYKHHEFIGSVDITHQTHLESEYDIYKNKNNVIVPKNKYFQSIKNLFDHSKIENFGIFDYSNMLPEIIFIQKSWRKHKIVKKFMVWRYAIRCFLLLQRWIRAHIVRRKFREFKMALKFVRKLQIFYRRRFEEKTISAIKIQSIVRMKMARIYYLMKLAREEVHEESDEEEQNSTEELEEVQPEFMYEEIEVEVTVDSDDEENSQIDLGIDDGIEIIDEQGLLIGVSDRKSVMNLVNSNRDSVSMINNISKDGKRNSIPMQIANDVSKRKSVVNIVTPGRRSITCIEDLNDLNGVKKVEIQKKPKKNKIPKKKNFLKTNNEHVPDGKDKKGLNENVFKKKKKVKKIVRKIIYPDDVQLFEKKGQKGVLERAKKYKKVTRIESGYSRYLKNKRKMQTDYTEKELGNVSQSKIDKRSMINENSVIGKKIFQNNMTRVSVLERDTDKMEICELLMRTDAVKGTGQSVDYLNDNYGLIKKNLRDSQKKLNLPNNNKPKQKIEDRLLSYGQHVKIKKDWKTRVDIDKQEKIRFNEMDIELNKEKEYTPNFISKMLVKKNNYSNFKKNPNRSQDDIRDANNNEEIEFDLWPEINKKYVKENVMDNTFTDNNNIEDFFHY